jgi:hypothetical protein
MSTNGCSPGCFGEYLCFKKLIAPVVIQVLFWIGVLAVFCTGLKVLITKDFVAGLLLMIVGPFLVRLVAELLLVWFKIYEALIEKTNQPAIEPVKAPRKSA